VSRRDSVASVSTAIWRKRDDEWLPLSPAGFPNEEKLHDLIQEAPQLLPLSGDPTLTMLGREVLLGSGYADLLAVEADGRPTIIEIKLGRNAEARRAVVAQILTYAANLKTTAVEELEELLRLHLAKIDAVSISDAVQRTDQSGQFDASAFRDALAAYLDAGAFRLVLVLDEAPSELVRLVGYLESITTAITVDLITVSAYEAGGEEILVPARVDPEYQPEQLPQRSVVQGRRPSKTSREVDGSDAFEQAVDRAPAEHQVGLRRLLEWARTLEADQLATLKSVFGDGREILLVWVRGEKAGLVSIWNDNGAYVSLWRTVFLRLAWDHVGPIEQHIGKAIGQGSVVRDPNPKLLELLSAAYRDAAQGPPVWNQQDFYVSFGANDQRLWEEAVELGFISAGGGEWYSRSLQMLKPGHRVFVYIPKGNGVGGYVGVGTVTAEAMPAKDFMVSRNGNAVPYLSITGAPDARQFMDDPKMAEWVVPVEWLVTRSRQDAVKDSDLFANQNCATKLTHGYTIKKLTEAFGVPQV
jgi:hypothetical protein